MNKLLAALVFAFLPLSVMAAKADFIAAQSEVRNLMKDPDSTTFRNLRGIINSQGVKYVCGEVNAKNSYGGYVGYKPFAFKDGHVSIDGDYRTSEDLEFFSLSGCGGADLEKMAMANKQAKVGCEVTWGQITDVVLFNMSPESAADNAIAKIKLKNPALDAQTQRAMRAQSIASIQATVSNKEFVDSVKKNTTATKEAFMKQCVSTTSQTLSGM
ncbi:hypothetical protein [Superficieibacter sp. HKU1]|uniref:hypothetical protein n=1 Tax=Superficieibacter sp. HKU1 TaxID=3031919 RepID=UPI0023E2C1AC|nr:hypothetical protein [Superficieibacter sp. HKU1]WES69663.1 hypothetical protein P0H77_06650 [Superficieibacter sp. HKU1]